MGDSHKASSSQQGGGSPRGQGQNTGAVGRFSSTQDLPHHQPQGQYASQIVPGISSQMLIRPLPPPPMWGTGWASPPPQQQQQSPPEQNRYLMPQPFDPSSAAMPRYLPFVPASTATSSAVFPVRGGLSFPVRSHHPASVLQPPFARAAYVPLPSSSGFYDTGTQPYVHDQLRHAHAASIPPVYTSASFGLTGAIRPSSQQAANESEETSSSSSAQSLSSNSASKPMPRRKISSSSSAAAMRTLSEHAKRARVSRPDTDSAGIAASSSGTAHGHKFTLAMTPFLRNSSDANPAATSNSSSTDFNGEGRLLIHFEDFGTVSDAPPKIAEKAVIPDGIRGHFSSYGERWYFQVRYADIKTTKSGKPLVLVRWLMRNSEWDAYHSVEEDEHDAMRREDRGVTVCNKVFTEALEARAKDYEKVVREEEAKADPNQLKIANLQSRIKSLRPRRISEGPLLFGLRHKVVQDHFPASRSSSPNPSDDGS